MWLELLLWLLMGSYAVFTLSLWWIWRGMKAESTDAIDFSNDNELFLSVIIPVRNEAANILSLLDDLDKQTLDKHLYEIWIVDDGSTDETRSLVKEFASSSDLNLYLIELTDNRALSPKKRAITEAIKRAEGMVLVTTDGDCRVGEKWLSTIASCYRTTGAKCISGPVTFVREEQLTDYLQTIEFSSLVGSGACSLAVGRPTMCNGANFSYEKEAFLAVGGFEGVDHIASGDDELLLHKFAEHYPGQLYFLKSEDAIVQTKPHRRWKDFKKQRQRWASKWEYYQNSTPRLLAVFIFMVNLSLLVSAIFFGSGLLSGYTFTATALLKLLPEWLFIGGILRFLRKERALLLIPLVQLIYPVYVVFFGLAGRRKNYDWKGRVLK